MFLIFVAWMKIWVVKNSMENLKEFSGYLRRLLWMNSVENWKEFKWLRTWVGFNGINGYSWWQKFKGNGDASQNGEQVSQITSLQQFILHDFDAGDHGTSSFTVSAAHRIGTLEIHISKHRSLSSQLLEQLPTRWECLKDCCASSDIIQGFDMRLNWRWTLAYHC